MQCLANGSLFIQGRVDEVAPPHSRYAYYCRVPKPRTCHDERFLNLWISDLFLTLDYISHLHRYVGFISNYPQMIKAGTNMSRSVRTVQHFCCCCCSSCCCFVYLFIYFWFLVAGLVLCISHYPFWPEGYCIDKTHDRYFYRLHKVACGSMQPIH